ncbi:hypothetical protein [Arhodomonas sp. AD133]|uniref:hypothetical protein n=1 Tax=Arhodomonas sp. AD133 TaxID=3415009 RepID=UPI003EB9C0A7
MKAKDKGRPIAAECCIHFFFGHEHTARWRHCRTCGEPLEWRYSDVKRDSASSDQRETLDLFGAEARGGAA